MYNYIKLILLFSFSLLLLVSSFNYFVNPFGLFNSPDIKGVNSNKTQAYTRGRILKAYAPIDKETEILLVGDSRVQLGLNPEYSAFQGKKVYNLGLPGADIRTQSQYTYNVAANTKVKEIIMGVDFVDFIFTKDKKYRHLPESYDFRLKSTLNQPLNPKYQWNKTKEYFAALLSLDALSASAVTLASQNSSLSHMTRDGRMVDSEFFSIVNNEGLGVLFDQKESNLTAKFSRPGWLIVNENSNTSHNFEIFIQLIQELQNKGIKISLFISPYHVSYLQILVKTSMYEKFKSWKQLLVSHLDQINYFDQGVLWDFSEPNIYTKETIPPRDKTGLYMKWFWEPAHYRLELGDKVLDTLLLNQAPWGTQLFPETKEFPLDNSK